MEISSIRIQLADKKQVDIAITDARELYDRLHELFGKKETVYVGGRCGCWRCHGTQLTWTSGTGAVLSSSGATWTSN